MVTRSSHNSGVSYKKLSKQKLNNYTTICIHLGNGTRVEKTKERTGILSALRNVIGSVCSPPNIGTISPSSSSSSSFFSSSNSWMFPSTCDNNQSSYRLQAYMLHAYLRSHSSINKTEMRMFRWIHRNSLKDQEWGYSKESKSKPIVAHITKRWLSRYGHIRRRDPDDITRMVPDEVWTHTAKRPWRHYKNGARRGMDTYGEETLKTLQEWCQTRYGHIRRRDPDDITRMVPDEVWTHTAKRPWRHYKNGARRGMDTYGEETLTTLQEWCQTRYGHIRRRDPDDITRMVPDEVWTHTAKRPWRHYKNGARRGMDTYGEETLTTLQEWCQTWYGHIRRRAPDDITRMVPDEVWTHMAKRPWRHYKNGARRGMDTYGEETLTTLQEWCQTRYGHIRRRDPDDITRMVLDEVWTHTAKRPWRHYKNGARRGMDTYGEETLATLQEWCQTRYGHIRRRDTDDITRMVPDEVWTHTAKRPWRHYKNGARRGMDTYGEETLTTLQEWCQTRYGHIRRRDPDDITRMVPDEVWTHTAKRPWRHYKNGARRGMDTYGEETLTTLQEWCQTRYGHIRRRDPDDITRMVPDEVWTHTAKRPWRHYKNGGRRGMDTYGEETLTTLQEWCQTRYGHIRWRVPEDITRMVPDEVWTHTAKRPWRHYKNGARRGMDTYGEETLTTLQEWCQTRYGHIRRRDPDDITRMVPDEVWTHTAKRPWRHYKNGARRGMDTYGEETLTTLQEWCQTRYGHIRRRDPDDITRMVPDEVWTHTAKRPWRHYKNGARRGMDTYGEETLTTLQEWCQTRYGHIRRRDPDNITRMVPDEVWTHTVKRPWRHYKNGARRGMDTYGEETLTTLQEWCQTRYGHIRRRDPDDITRMVPDEVWTHTAKRPWRHYKNGARRGMDTYGKETLTTLQEWCQTRYGHIRRRDPDNITRMVPDEVWTHTAKRPWQHYKNGARRGMDTYGEETLTTLQEWCQTRYGHIRRRDPDDITRMVPDKVWTHTAKRPWRHYKNGARRGMDTYGEETLTTLQEWCQTRYGHIRWRDPEDITRMVPDEVWTHTAKRPWRHYKNGARQGMDTYGEETLKTLQEWCQTRIYLERDPDDITRMVPDEDIPGKRPWRHYKNGARRGYTWKETLKTLQEWCQTRIYLERDP